MTGSPDDRPRIVGRYGEQTIADGSSRPFVPGSTDPRTLVAEVIARRDGWAEIRPRHWRDAGAIITALKGAGMLRTAKERKALG